MLQFIFHLIIFFFFLVTFFFHNWRDSPFVKVSYAISNIYLNLSLVFHALISYLMYDFFFCINHLNFSIPILLYHSNKHLVYGWKWFMNANIVGRYDACQVQEIRRRNFKTVGFGRIKCQRQRLESRSRQKQGAGIVSRL